MRPEDLRNYTTDPTQNGWLVSSATVLVLTAVVWWVVQLPPVARRLDGPDRAVATPVDTKGVVVPVSSSGDQQKASEAEADRNTVRHLDSIALGAGTGGFVGRTVDLKGTVHQKGSGRAFWLGDNGPRFLVVQHLTGAAPRQGHAMVGTHRRLPVQKGQMVRVTGTVEALPPRIERRVWGLTSSSDREVERIGVYINAVDVQTEGHGG